MEKPVRVILIVVDAGPVKLNRLHAAIDARFEEWWHHMGPVFFVRTELTVNEVHDWLARHRRESDSAAALLVEVSPNTLSGWLPERAWPWFDLPRSRSRGTGGREARSPRPGSEERCPGCSGEARGYLATACPSCAVELVVELADGLRGWHRSP